MNLLDLIRKLVRTLRDLTLFEIVMLYNSHGNKTFCCSLKFRWVSLGKFSVAYRVYTTASSCTWIAPDDIEYACSKGKSSTAGSWFLRRKLPRQLFFYRTRENFLTKPIFFLPGSKCECFQRNSNWNKTKSNYIVPELER